MMSTFAKAERSAFGGGIQLGDLRNFVLLEHSLALGTALHGTPLLPALKAVVPHARIVAAASGFGLGVLQGNPELERLIAMPSPLVDLPGAVRAMRAARIFAGEPYALLQTTGNGRTRVTVAAMLSGGHTRVGFAVHPELSAAALAFDPQRSQIANNLAILTALGHGAALQDVLAREPYLAEPRVYPSAGNVGHVRGMLVDMGISEAEPIAVFVTQTSPTQRKSWRAERFRSAAEMLGREYGAQIVFGGTAGESARVEELRAGLRVRNASLAGRTSPLEMAALFGTADVALSLDTGPMHLARAMGTPMVIVAPAWSPPLEWLPVGNPRARILKNLDLSRAPEDYVIDEVSVEQVEAALRELLAVYPPRSRAKTAPAPTASG